MYLTDLAKAIVHALNSSSPESWKTGGYSVPTDVEAKFALDPFTDSMDKQPNIFVIPYYIEYDLTGVRKSKLTSDRKFVTVVLGMQIKPKDLTPSYDITTIEEATKIIDLKEDLDNFLSKLVIPGAKLRDMEVEPLDELKIQDSYYIAPTVLGYDSC